MNPVRRRPTRSEAVSSPEGAIENSPGDGRGGQPEAVLLGRPHAEELAAAVDEGGQGPGVGVRERADVGPDGLGEVGQGGRVQPVRLGRPAGRLGEPAGLAGG